MPETLVLVPTPLERELLAPALAGGLGASARLELCGFGPVVAAARTAALIATLKPRRVLLAGIAGRLDDRLAIGSAYRFREVACYGVGVCSAAEFIPAEHLGWQQWPGEPDAAGETSYSSFATAAAIGDRLSSAAGRSAAPTDAGLLLTACAASATASDLRQRQRLYPEAEAEDMEGFAVALACRLGGVPLSIVRGISNDAGDRDKSRWQIPRALAAAAALSLRILTEES